MGFWVYMLVMNLLIPFTMIGFGRYFEKGGPKEINGVFGYRTPMSMKNKDTWEFAHKHCGRIWYICGWISLAATVVCLLLLLGKDEDVVGTASSILVGAQLAVIIASVLPTERALRKEFDKNGNRR
ncbi:SdpI family protein [Candidatus Allofournierella excrementavium]|uniref:SdpI family protein n=1 Tax=Candidatus Allofournierella excrementavium TaxID=2838591 RepID=UPI00374EF1ED